MTSSASRFRRDCWSGYFPKVYGIKFDDVVDDEDLAIGTFPARREQNNSGNDASGVAYAQKTNCGRHTECGGEEISCITCHALTTRGSGGASTVAPGFGTRVLAIVLKLFPKKGPFSGLDFKIPTRQAEDLFVQSIDDTVASYRRLLQDVTREPCI